jgi:hypothetical protein
VASSGTLLTNEFAWINDFYSLHFYGGFRGLELLGDSNALTFYSSNLENQVDAAVWVPAGNALSRVNFIGGTVEGAVQGFRRGFLIEHPMTSLTIQGMYFENNSQHIEFAHNPVVSGTSVTIRDCRFTNGGGSAGIELATAQRVFCSYNTFRSQALIHVNHESNTGADAVYVGLDNTSYDSSPEVAFTAGSVMTRSTGFFGQDHDAYGSPLARSELKRNGHPIPDFEHGSASVNPGVSIVVGFTNTFAGIPTVVVSHSAATSRDGVLRVSGVTTTGFTLHNDSSSVSTANYIAAYSQ